MSSSQAQSTVQPQLAPFRRRFAPTVSGWVTTREQLRVLAPTSSFPLTPVAVCRWVRPGGTAFVLVRATHTPRSDVEASDSGDPIGYGELNPMRAAPDHLWIGHVVINPKRRGQGFGHVLTRLLIDEAFTRRGARRISLVVFPHNVAAIRCYQKAGFSLLREEYHHLRSRRTQQRLLRFELLKGDHWPSALSAFC